MLAATIAAAAAAAGSVVRVEVALVVYVVPADPIH